MMSCGGGGSYKIKMTTEAGGDVELELSGNGIVTVDWGDGSEKVSLTLGVNYVLFKHTYPSATIRDITINGDDIIVMLQDCGKTELYKISAKV